MEIELLWSPSPLSPLSPLPPPIWCNPLVNNLVRNKQQCLYLLFNTLPLRHPRPPLRHHLPTTPSDDSSSAVPTLLANVTGFLCSPSFHESSGAVIPSALHPHSSVLEWFSARCRSNRNSQ
ncbi:hypothetical protein VIGAN_11028600 [Vigna angularis var. angularis]|uniref:Uncharacterized protein n=1 Tax=Vigna angularis var. angularis TaxID=157739 RepID=A0A0S3T808_PHAAN|nr:hypothetical protein VIGAN_11028600 [Vigna angularis var. angularis]